MCLSDIEHMTHLFFDCKFAVDFWHHVNMWYDWSSVENAHEWLFEKISCAPVDEVARICTVLWGVWFWRNKKVWDDKTVTPAFAMDSCFRIYSEWLDAKKQNVPNLSQSKSNRKKGDNIWQPPKLDSFKVNVDASLFPNAQNFKVGIVLRDHLGSFIAGKVKDFSMIESVFEAEMVGIGRFYLGLRRTILQKVRSYWSLTRFKALKLSRREV